MQLDTESTDFGTPNACSNTDSYGLVLQNTTGNDHNVALDNQRNIFLSSNPNVDFFTHCNLHGNIGGEPICPNSFYHLVNS